MTWIDDLQSAGDHATKVKGDLEYFAQYLKIRPKVGSLAPFTLNAAQLKLHELIEDQRRRTGRVRVIVLKARPIAIRDGFPPLIRGVNYESKEEGAYA